MSRSVLRHVRNQASGLSGAFLSVRDTRPDTAFHVVADMAPHMAAQGRRPQESGETEVGDQSERRLAIALFSGTC